MPAVLNLRRIEKEQPWTCARLRYKTQGTLFFEVARIIDDKRPSAFLLENVKHLARHDRGRTMETILETLSGDLGYHVYEPEVLDALHVAPRQINHN